MLMDYHNNKKMNKNGITIYKRARNITNNIVVTWL